MGSNGYIWAIWSFLWHRVIKNSVIYRVLCGVYAFFSKKWHESFIINLFKRSFFNEGAESKSIIGKICFFPFV